MFPIQAGRQWPWLPLILAPLLLLLSIGSSPCAPDGPHTVVDRADYIYRDSGVVPPQWRPDKNAILYRFTHHRGFTNEVYAVSPDGSEAVSIVDPDADNRASISPDWSRLAYAYWESPLLSPTEQHWEIFTSAPDGSQKRRLTKGKPLDLAPEWSPDGSRIAFFSSRKGGGLMHLYTMDPDGSDKRYIAPTGSPGRYRYGRLIPPIWSPDSRRIAFAHQGGAIEGSRYTSLELSIAELDSSDVRFLGKAITFPAWSPDSRRIAFLRPGEPGRNVTLRIVGVDGLNGADVYELNAEFNNPRGGLNNIPDLEWSPDGTKVLLAHGGVIATIGADGTNFLQLTNFNSYNENDVKLRAAWSPDGSKIAVGVPSAAILFPHEVATNKSIALFTMDPDGLNRRILAYWMSMPGNEWEVRIEMYPGHNDPWPESLNHRDKAYLTLSRAATAHMDLVLIMLPTAPTSPIPLDT